MTDKELRALDYIRESIATTGCAPTLEQIARRTGGRTKSEAWRIVDNLVRTGRIAREAGRRRGLRVIGNVDLTAVPTDALHVELARRARPELKAA